MNYWVTRLFLIFSAAFLICLYSCSVSRQISKQAATLLLKDSAVSTGHIGISIYEPATNKYWYEHDAVTYFVPASNTKLFTLYAGMRYLGDSLPGLKFALAEPTWTNSTLFVIQPTGDPTFMHPDFPRQPVMDILKENSFMYKDVTLHDKGWRDTHWGNGWAWNDYEDDYMAERNSFPIYGNVIKVALKENAERRLPLSAHTHQPGPNELSIFKTQHPYFDSLVNRNLHLLPLDPLRAAKPGVRLKRNLSSNDYFVELANRPFSNATIPFVTNGNETTIRVLAKTLKMPVAIFPGGSKGNSIEIKHWQTVYSQPSDSMFRPMMHNSDNFFAEQTLLMASNIKLGYMSAAKMIDTILKTDLKDLPQKPRWVDGSGLSRYNMFTPRSFVYILNKMKDEFGLDRMKQLLATGGQGTLASYYKKDSTFIYAKTGTLTSHCALSGYLITKKGKLLIFSILANHYQSGATPIRKAVERFLHQIREKY